MSNFIGGEEECATPLSTCPLDANSQHKHIVLKHITNNNLGIER